MVEGGMVVRTLAGLLGVLSVAAPVAAKEYPLDPGASGASIDGIVHMTPLEIDVTRPDYVLIVGFRNDSEQPVMMRLNEFRCLRGSTIRRPFDDNDPEWLYLRPHQVRTLQFVCVHGRDVTGDFGLVIRRIVTNPYGDQEHPGESLVEDVVWKLREADITEDRQRSGDELACLRYRRPPHRILGLEAAPSCDRQRACGPVSPAPGPLGPASRSPPPAATLRRR
jgi:hypothetical protein